MDKNTLLAVVLSGAIMVGWYAMFPPPDPPPIEIVNTGDQEYTDRTKNSVRQESAEFNVQDSTLSSTVPSSSIKDVDSSLPSKEVSE